MNHRLWIAIATVAVAALSILAACGGGSSMSGTSSGSAVMASGGASGVITGFGSVFVNGHEYATDASTQVLDGDNDDAPSSTANLQVGMTVDLDAAGGQAATMLRITSAVRGEVDAVDTMGSTLTVLGQTVQVTSGTSFAGRRTSGSSTTPIAQLSNINVGDYVVVFGYLECAGTCGSSATSIVASLVYEPATASIYRVQGYVAGAGSTSFVINGLTVDISTSGASPTRCNTMNCAFSNGQFVAVRSTSKPTGAFVSGSSTLTLTADDIKLRQEAPTFAVGSTVTIEGPVRQLGSTGFVVRGISVDASNVLSSLTGLANNQIVEVTGTISSNGTLLATAITVERHATMTIMAPLDSASSGGLSVLGQSFGVNDDTRFVDWWQGVRPFNSSNFSTVLKAGDQLIVSGYPAAGGNVATRVERIPPPSSPTAAVEGVVSADSASSDTLTVAGVSVTVGSTTQLFYAGAGSTPSLPGFFAAITPNSSIAAAFGAPGSMMGTLGASDALVLNLGAYWGD
jgi:uncharacterized protein DUF5666